MYNTSTNNSSSELSKRLNTAAIEGKNEDVTRLIKEGSAFLPVGSYGMNPLHSAATNGHLEVCRTLVNSKVLIDTVNMVKKTALHMAAANGHTKVVDLLLSAGASVDICDMLKMTPLHWACDRGHSKVASLLIQHGADPDRLNKFQKSPRYLAKEKNHSDIIRLMEADGRIPNDSEVKEITITRSSTSDLGEIPSIFNEEPVRMDSNEETSTDENLQDLLNILNRSCDLSDLDEEDPHEELIRSIDRLESCSFDLGLSDDFENAADELLRAEAALMVDDPLRELKMAIRLGQTIKLTEAGKIAFSMIIPEEHFVIPNDQKQRKENQERENEAEKDAKKPECNTVALRNQSFSELYNELKESCNFQVRSCRSPSSKRYKR